MSIYIRVTTRSGRVCQAALTGSEGSTLDKEFERVLGAINLSDVATIRVGAMAILCREIESIEFLDDFVARSDRA